MRQHFVGVDLGQSSDPTAIAVVENVGGVLHCGHLERVPLGTTYPRIVERVAAIMGRLPFTAELAIDATGVGRPVADMFDQANLDFVGVLISGGSSESTLDSGYVSVPKGTLVSHVQAALHSGALKIHADLPETPTLLNELRNFRVSFSAVGNMTFSARSGKHDDIVLALALAVWLARRHSGQESISVPLDQVFRWSNSDNWPEPSVEGNFREATEAAQRGELKGSQLRWYLTERHRRAGKQ
jgi:phage FluMu gp28-like protein